MSDDIPIIYAQAKVSPPPVAIFLSAGHATQLEQYVLAGWQVRTAEDFTGCDIPPELLVDVFDPGALEAPPALLMGEIASLTEGWRHTVTLFAPQVVKINAAFSKDADAVTQCAAFLSGQGYSLCASYWENDNAFGRRILSRIDALSVFQPTPWTQLNLIAYKDPGVASEMLRFGRFYAGQEKRIGDLEVSHAIRGDYISQLEDAMMAYQQEGAAGDK